MDKLRAAMKSGALMPRKAASTINASVNRALTATSSTFERGVEAVKRKVELKLVREILRLNRECEFQARMIKGALLANGIYNVNDVETQGYVQTGTMPTLEEICWLKKEQRIQAQLREYVELRQTMAVHYEQKYWQYKNSTERHLSFWNNIEGEALAAGIWGAGNTMSEWRNCARIHKLMEEEARLEDEARAAAGDVDSSASDNEDYWSYRRKIREGFGRLGQNVKRKIAQIPDKFKKKDPLDPTGQPFHCHVCYACKPIDRKMQISRAYDDMYAGYHNMTLVAFERAQAVAGELRLHWQPPARVPGRGTTPRDRMLDAAVLYMWADREDFAYFGL